MPSWSKKTTLGKSLIIYKFFSNTDKYLNANTSHPPYRQAWNLRKPFQYFIHSRSQTSISISQNTCEFSASFYNLLSPDFYGMKRKKKKRTRGGNELQHTSRSLEPLWLFYPRSIGLLTNFQAFRRPIYAHLTNVVEKRWIPFPKKQGKGVLKKIKIVKKTVGKNGKTSPHTWGNFSRIPPVWISSHPSILRSISISESRPSNWEGLGDSFSGGRRTFSSVRTTEPYFFKGGFITSFVAVAILVVLTISGGKLGEPKVGAKQKSIDRSFVILQNGARNGLDSKICSVIRFSISWLSGKMSLLIRWRTKTKKHQNSLLESDSQKLIKLSIPCTLYNTTDIGILAVLRKRFSECYFID